MKILLGLFFVISIPATWAETLTCPFLDDKQQSQLDVWPNTTNNVVREYVEKRNLDYEHEMRAKKNLVEEVNKISWLEAEKMIRMGLVFRVLIGDKNIVLFSTSGHRYETIEPKSGVARHAIEEIDPCHIWIAIILT